MITAQPLFRPFGAAFRSDPYPAYRALRDAGAVHRALGMCVLTRHADVVQVLRSDATSVALIPGQVARRVAALPLATAERIDRLGRTSLVFTDDPAHARLRRLVNRVFTGPACAAVRPLADAAAGRLLDRIGSRGQGDAITDLAGPLPVAVLGAWMGLPDDVRSLVAGWTHSVRFLLEPGLMGPRDVAEVGAAVDAFTAAIDQVVAARRARPGPDLLSRLLAVREGGDRLTDREVTCVVVMCFVAGHATTTALIGNALAALLDRPDQAALLAADPARIPAAVAETLRFDSPLQMTKRLAVRDIALPGGRIEAGEQVLLCLGGANRDPEVFPAPDVFDLDRDTRRQLALGGGMHRCLGGPLAQLQAGAVLAGLGHRSWRLEPDPDAGAPRWQSATPIVRGLETLPVRVGR